MSDTPDYLPELQSEFLDELQYLLEACEESYLKIENPEIRVEELAKIFRLAHSIKGAGAAVGFADLAAFAHVVEDCLAVLRTNPDLVDTATTSILLKCGDAIKARATQLRSPQPPLWDIESLQAEVSQFTELLRSRHSAIRDEPPAPPVRLDVESSQKPGTSTLKVDSQRVDELLNLVGELVVIKSQILNEAGGLPKGSRLGRVASLLDKTIRELQAQTLGMRLTSLKSLYVRCNRVARDLSVRLNKPLELSLKGEQIEMDRSVVEQLTDPLMHLVRNCIGHGIESIDARKKAGKPEKGQIGLRAQQRGGRVVFELHDDGAGISRERVIQKAVELGLLTSAQDPNQLSEAQVYELLFAPGFSTATQVSDVSGRGVGMDVVRKSIEQLKGHIEVHSTPGQGTQFRISLPVTTAITEGLLVRAAAQTYILPVDGIRQLVDFSLNSVVDLPQSGRWVNIRGKFYPLVNIADCLRDGYAGRKQQEQDCGANELVVLYDYGTGWVALQVDGVLGQAQVVMKSLGAGNASVGVAGAAILGTGEVALLLDVSALVRLPMRPEVPTPDLNHAA